jgi:hypothetical protein
MSNEPTHWYEHNCEFCFERTNIVFDDYRPENIFCPCCGTAVESADDLDFYA